MRRWHAPKAGRTQALYDFHRDGRPLGVFRDMWLTACRRAGLGQHRFHSLQRNASRDMSLQGVSEKVIMSMTGHKTRGMFDRHNVVTEADPRVYAKRLFGP